MHVLVLWLSHKGDVYLRLDLMLVALQLAVCRSNQGSVDGLLLQLQAALPCFKATTGGRGLNACQ